MSFLDPPTFDVTILMADSAQVSGGKLYILGGGISILQARPTPVAVVMLIRVPWSQANIRHEWILELLDEDSRPVMAGDRPLLIKREFESGRPAGLPEGIALDVPLALNFPALPVEADKRYTWRLSINGNTDEDWQISFSVIEPRPAPPTTPAS